MNKQIDIIFFMKSTILNIEKGYYTFKLKNILTKRNITINKLMRDTNTDFKVIKRLMNGEMVKIDIFVLARLCNYFDCSINDIVTYTNKKESKN